MKVFLLRCTSVLVILVPTVCLSATWALLIPDDTDPYDQITLTSNIGCAGFGPMNGAGVVACRQVGGLVEQQESFTTLMSGYWSATLSAPSGGWIEDMGTEKHEVYIVAEPTTLGYVQCRK